MCSDINFCILVLQYTSALYFIPVYVRKPHNHCIDYAINFVNKHENIGLQNLFMKFQLICMNQAKKNQLPDTYM